MLSRAKKGAVATPGGVRILERLMGIKYIQYIGWVISEELYIQQGTFCNILKSLLLSFKEHD